MSDPIPPSAHTTTLLLVVRDLLASARHDIELGSNLSALRALLHLDLCVEQLLIAALLTLSTTDKPAKQEQRWVERWDSTTRALREAQLPDHLPHRRLLQTLHGVRNQAQHAGMLVHPDEPIRYLIAVEEFADFLVEQLTGKPLHSFRRWSLLPLPSWLNDEAQTLEDLLNQAHDADLVHRSINIGTSLVSAFTDGAQSATGRKYLDGDIGLNPPCHGARGVAELRDALERLYDNTFGAIEELQTHFFLSTIGISSRRIREFERLHSKWMGYPWTTVPCPCQGGDDLLDGKPPCRAELRRVLDFLFDIALRVHLEYPGTVEVLELSEFWADIIRRVRGYR